MAVITGGAGLLGMRHAEAIIELGGAAVLVDVDEDRIRECPPPALGLTGDITDKDSVERVLREVLARFGRVDILINNAANNPKVEATDEGSHWSRLDSFPVGVWNQDLAVGLTGAFLCAQAFGGEMARRGGGVILNIASDLALIGPDQRLYRHEGVADERQPVKPVSYSVVKAGLIGLTRYLATYWAGQGVRVNAICPGGVFTGQDPEFVRRLSALIPMGRMADPDEYKAAVAFLISDASSYMTGSILVVDGGRTCW